MPDRYKNKPNMLSNQRCAYINGLRHFSSVTACICYFIRFLPLFTVTGGAGVVIIMTGRIVVLTDVFMIFIAARLFLPVVFV
ncbi:hypothetical protein Metlim_0004 [Methanoplanus limicola DSM 2279]|uniref:Uncharacterized protein n=1 Tax=Methanoplanus limicola DSM 2279 TaxID=937775 RepID=H1YY62_9EURY|nr:hypothetical protein Metlim_0004 [Methanoplanus limicola DSM 2279]